MRAQIKRAFTLVEILIVVVILGILAAVVVPQFVDAADQAQTGNTETQLRTLRTQIQLFRAQSDTNAFPVLANTNAEAAWAPMIDEDLLQAPPINPRTNSGTVVDYTATGVLADDIDAAMANRTDGWFYDAVTGQIWACAFNENYRDPDDTNTGEPWPAP